jgi:valyl-tRNA synthetase
MNVERAREAGIEVDPSVFGETPAVPADAPLEARWIVARLNSVAAEVNVALANYRFDEAANFVYQYFWGDFCDWYLEIVKLRLDFADSAAPAATKSALATLLQTFESALRLLSPFMPFITEELWHALYDDEPPGKSIALTRYPLGAAHRDDRSETSFALLQELIVSVRALRKDLGVEERASVPIRIRALSDGLAFEENFEIIQRLARVSGVESVSTMPEGAVFRSTSQFDVEVIYEKTIDIPAERERLTKELAKLEKALASAERQLSNPAFLEKAPPHVVEGLRKMEADTRLLIEKNRKALEDLTQEGRG